jgi:hypothetical protein
LLLLLLLMSVSVCLVINTQSMIMTDPADKLDPMSLLFYMSSFSVVLLLPATLILEPGVFGEVSLCGGIRLVPNSICYQS